MSDVSDVEYWETVERLDGKAARNQNVKVAVHLWPQTWRSLRREHRNGSTTLTEIINTRILDREQAFGAEVEIQVEWSPAQARALWACIWAVIGFCVGVGVSLWL